MPLLVVDGEHVGVLLVEDARPGAPRPLRRRPTANEPGVVVGRLAVHAGVAVAEELHPSTPRIFGRGVGLGDPAVGERLAGGQDAFGHLAELAPRREHEHDAVTRRRGPGHRAAGGDRFVVGVGVEGDERVVVARARVCQRLGAQVARRVRESLVSRPQPDVSVGLREPWGDRMRDEDASRS